MSDLALTILVHEGPIARAYLAALRAANLRVERIILLVSSLRAGTKKPVAAWLPGKLRRRYAEWDQEARLNYWPRKISRDLPELQADIAANVAPELGFAPAILDEMAGAMDYSLYASEVTKTLVHGLDDPDLATLLTRHAPGAILYTGGGMVPASLLSIPGLRFLHVHPGFLPYVRGADCILWSRLVRGRLGASCFYMAPKIDMGDLVCAHEFPASEFPFPKGKQPDDLTLYRALFSYYDPLLRAAVLLRALSLGANPMSLPSAPQATETGVTYHFMSPSVKRAALARFFP
jgi:hypothetical protein